MAADSTLMTKNSFFAASTDVKRLTTSHDDLTGELEEFVNNHPIVIKLKSQPEFSKSLLKSEIRHNFIGRTLVGPGKVVVSPLTWIETGGKSLVQISYLGMEMR